MAKPYGLRPEEKKTGQDRMQGVGIHTVTCSDRESKIVAIARVAVS